MPPFDSLHYVPCIHIQLQIPTQPIRSFDTSYMYSKVFHFVLPFCDVFKRVSFLLLGGHSERDQNIIMKSGIDKPQNLMNFLRLMSEN